MSASRGGLWTGGSAGPVAYDVLSWSQNSLTMQAHATLIPRQFMKRNLTEMRGGLLRSPSTVALTVVTATALIYFCSNHLLGFA